ncbi:MAG: hypothetical protein ACP5SH_11125 [Syntrophobacteraceae bacterium]
MSKSKIGLACFFLFCGFLVVARAAAPVKGNSCVQCHSKLPLSSFYGVKSHSWVGSVHEQHGVTCNECHGGNPEAQTKEPAHTGLLPSSNPQSPVYFKNIPATCGKCHGAEFYNFSRSLHYKILESTGKGPTCVTCHGSMVTRVLTPGQLVDVCARCHNQRMAIAPYVPQKAMAVLLLLRESRALLAADRQLYASPKCAGAAQTLNQAEVSLQAAKLNWHKFDLNAITNHLEKFHDALKNLPPASSCR